MRRRFLTFPLLGAMLNIIQEQVWIPAVQSLPQQEIGRTPQPTIRLTALAPFAGGDADR